jgi:hypothetical protein
MKLNIDNTDFVSFFVGLSHKELDELELLVKSFKKNFDHKMIVMDMAKASLELVAKGNIMWQQDRAYTYDIEPTLTLKEVNEFFSRYKDVIIREESEFYETRSYRTNRVMYEVATKDNILLLDSDIEFLNGEFLNGVNKLLENIEDNEFGMLGNYISAYEFGVDSKIYSSRKFNIFNILLKASDALRNFVTRNKFKLARGIVRSANYDSKQERQKGMFPRIDPAFLLLNRKKFTELKIKFNLLYLDVLDYSNANKYQEWRILGDESAGLVFEMAKNQLITINVNYTNWALHKGGSWQALKKKNANWFYLGRDLECSDREFWKKNKIPKNMIYKIK